MRTLIPGIPSCERRPVLAPWIWIGGACCSSRWAPTPSLGKFTVRSLSSQCVTVNPHHTTPPVFSTSKFQGVPIETDEMAPVEFAEDAMPYDKMWQDDRVWQPLLFRGERFQGMFEFDDGTTLLQHHLRLLQPDEAPVCDLDTPKEDLQAARYWTAYKL